MTERADITTENIEKTEKKRIFKEPGSAVTHLIAMIAAFAGLPYIAMRAAKHGSAALLSALVFMISMILLYGASTVYHTFDPPGHAATVLKRVDHLMVFVLIAGSYTPFCVMTLEPVLGHRLLIAVWSVAFIGMVVKFFWIYCPKWVSSLIYIGMGWLCVFAIPQLYRGLSHAAFGWLLAGGLLYSAGGVIYALKSKDFNERHPNFGTHEIFHLFVMGGSLCQYIAACMIF